MRIGRTLALRRGAKRCMYEAAHSMRRPSTDGLGQSRARTSSPQPVRGDACRQAAHTYHWKALTRMRVSMPRQRRRRRHTAAVEERRRAASQMKCRGAARFKHTITPRHATSVQLREHIKPTHNTHSTIIPSDKLRELAVQFLAGGGPPAACVLQPP